MSTFIFPDFILQDFPQSSTEKTYEVTDMFAEPPANGSRMYNIKLNIDKALRKNFPLIPFLPRCLLAPKHLIQMNESLPDLTN